MTVLRRRIHALALLPLLLLAAACASGKPLRLASDQWPPYTGTRAGAQVSSEIVAEALARQGVSIRTAITDWEKVMPGIRDGRFDGSAAVWRDAGREKVMLFSKAYLENQLVLVGRKGADVSAASLTELSGRRVAIVEGYAYGDDFEKDGAPTLVPGATNQVNLERLVRGEVDLMLIDELMIRYVEANQEEKAKKYLEIGTVPLVRRPLHFAVRRDLPGAEKIVATFDRTVREMMADGSYHRILRLSWIRADVDGDGRMEYVPARRTAGKTPPKGAFAVGAGKPGAPDRYYVDGRVYESWDDIPPRYQKEASSSAADEAVQVTFLDFDF